MRLPSLALVVAPLLSLTNACLTLSGESKSSHNISLSLIDNNVWVCVWGGVLCHPVSFSDPLTSYSPLISSQNYIAGVRYSMTCASGFAANFVITDRTPAGSLPQPAQIVVSYRHNGQDLQFATNGQTTCEPPRPNGGIAYCWTKIEARNYC